MGDGGEDLVIVSVCRRERRMVLVSLAATSTTMERKSASYLFMPVFRDSSFEFPRMSSVRSLLDDGPLSVRGKLGTIPVT